jgi:hypothetical protein
MQATPDPHFESWLTWLEQGQLAPELAELRRSEPQRFARREAQLRRFLGDLAEARFEPLTAAERQAAQACLLPAQRSPLEALGARLVQLAQRIVTGPELAPALRGGSPVGHFQGLYRAGAWDIDLGLGEDGRLRGQVLHQEAAELPSGARLFVLISGRPVQSLELADDGSFDLAPPAGSAFELQVEIGAESLLVTGLPILG